VFENVVQLDFVLLVAIVKPPDGHRSSFVELTEYTGETDTVDII
jgi:hypothetical protein